MDVTELLALIDQFKDIIEFVKRYITPQAFMDYAHLLVIEKYQYCVLYYEREVYGDRKYRLVEDILHVPTVVDHVTIPVIAYYDTDEELVVEIRTGDTKITQFIKNKGEKWVPLIKGGRPIIFSPNMHMDIKPKPKSVAVLRLEPVEGE